MKLLAVIPARGGSKGVPRKNIRMLAGKPLIAWTIKAARAAGALDRIVVSTEDEEIATISAAYGAEVMHRPGTLAEDATPTLAVLQHVVDALARQGYQPEAVMTLQPTSPLRRPEHIDEAAALFASDPTADSLVSCLQVPHVFHPLSVMKPTPEGYLAPYIDQDATPTRRQDKTPAFARNGAAIYITRTERLRDFVFGGRLIGYEMSEADSLDIDTEADLARAERSLGTRSTRG